VQLSAARIIGLAVFIAFLAWAFVFDVVIIRGNSMLPTLRADSLALVLRCSYGLRLPFSSGSYLFRWSLPAVDDIVVLDERDAAGNGSIKRVFEVGPAYLSSQAGRLQGRGGSLTLETDSPLRAVRNLYVPPDRIFVAGDNLAVSLDSRHYGSISVEHIRGRLLLPSPRTNRDPAATGQAGAETLP